MRLSNGQLLLFNLAGSTILAAWLVHSHPGPALPVGNPGLEVRPARLELGPVPVGDSAFGTLTVANRGTGVLRFRVESSCLCLRAHQQKDRLGPGEEARVNVRFRLPIPGEHKKVLYLLSNDPRDTDRSVEVVARIGVP
ncbi:MAG: DUF1573 domain-containing protein [Candidatus Eremiobacterota bacterium]